MWPSLRIPLPPLGLGDAVSVPTYALWVGLAFVVAARIRSREVARLGYDRDPRHTWVGLGALLGAMVGAKLGLLLFGPMDEVASVWAGVLSLDFTGKTVLGGIIGGWIGVEATKWALGIVRSTGDGFAEALLVGQGIGRLGCLFAGCCYGIPAALPIVDRIPVQLIEAAAVLGLAAWIRRLRDAGLPEGHRFRRAVVGYALVRAVLDPLRGDGHLWWGPLSAVQWACLAFAFLVGGRMVLRERALSRPETT